MTSIKRFLAVLLCLAMLLPMVPASAFAAEHDAYSLDNGYIQVNVSRKNGGFLVGTLTGNLLRKSDRDNAETIPMYFNLTRFV